MCVCEQVCGGVWVGVSVCVCESGCVWEGVCKSAWETTAKIRKVSGKGRTVTSVVQA